MKFFFLYLLLLGVPLTLLSQTNYQPGFIVKSQGDTVRGFIDFREWGNNPSKINFKKKPDGDIETLTRNDVTHFEITDKEAYRLFNLKISMNEIDVEHLWVGGDTSRIDSVFLKIIDKGDNITTFSYEDVLKTRFFVLERNSQHPKELVYQVYLDSTQDKRIIERRYYRNQLFFLYQKFVTTPNEKAISRINFATYTLRDMKLISEWINGKTNSNNKTGKRNIYPFVGVSLNRGRTWYEGDASLAQNANSKISYLPCFTVGLDSYYNPKIGKLILRGQLSLELNKGDISKTQKYRQDFHSFKQYMLTFSPQLVYNIYNGENLKFNLGSGWNAHFATYKDNIYLTKVYNVEQRKDEEDIAFKKFWYSFPLRAGVVINKKCEINANCALFKTPVSNHVCYSIYTSSFKIGVNYLFNRKDVGK